jgi:hypothetical protein
VPGAEAAYTDSPSMVPQDEEHRSLLSQLLGQWQAAQEARQPFEDRWTRYYRHYRSYVQRTKGDWRSKVFIPISFWVVETITPRMVSQLPDPLVHPVEQTDVEPAEVMEKLLRWAFDHRESKTYEEIVKQYKSALKYGTGILKTFHKEVRKKKRVSAPKMETETFSRELPVPDAEAPDGLLRDPDGNPVTEQVPEEYEVPALDEQGQPVYETTREEYVAYDGPASQWISNFNFWPAPDATDIDDARYVIHRTYTTWERVKELIEQGVYALPAGMDETQIFGTGDSDDPQARLLEEIGLVGGANASLSDPSRKVCEVLEFWTDQKVHAVLNRLAVIRVQDNPFDHEQKPFIRIVDHLVEGEFWGIGEIEPLEGLQDYRNAVTNDRMDNVRLVLNRMFFWDPSLAEDKRDFQMRPGGLIRYDSKNGPARDVLTPVDMPDVTGSAYEEAAAVDDVVAKTSGVNDYTMGADSPTMNDTATGISLIQEAGATRFGLKTRLAEMTGLRRLAEHYGAIIQQFWDQERTIRLTGERGAYVWETWTPEAMQGALDYDIEVASSVQTESMRQQMSLNLLNTLSGYLGGQQPMIDPATGGPMVDPATGQPVMAPMPPGISALIEDVLDAFNKKDVEKYLGQQQPPPSMEQGPTEPMAITPDLAAAVAGAGAPEEAS